MDVLHRYDAVLNGLAVRLSAREAKVVAGLPGVLPAVVSEVTYIHLMFDRHEVICADGAWSESFQPGARAIGGLEAEAADELFALFGAVPEDLALERYGDARLTLRAHEARALLSLPAAASGRIAAA